MTESIESIIVVLGVLFIPVLIVLIVLLGYKCYNIFLKNQTENISQEVLCKKSLFYKEHSFENFNLLDSSEQIKVLIAIVAKELSSDEVKQILFLRQEKINFEKLIELFNNVSIKKIEAKNTKKLEIKTTGDKILPNNIINL